MHLHRYMKSHSHSHRAILFVLFIKYTYTFISQSKPVTHTNINKHFLTKILAFFCYNGSVSSLLNCSLRPGRSESASSSSLAQADHPVVRGWSLRESFRWRNKQFRVNVRASVFGRPLAPLSGQVPQPKLWTQAAPRLRTSQCILPR